MEDEINKQTDEASTVMRALYKLTDCGVRAGRPMVMSYWYILHNDLKALNFKFF